MGSIGEEATIYGEFMHPVITAETKNNDPWQRYHNAPPPLDPLVPRYPLHVHSAQIHKHIARRIAAKSWLRSGQTSSTFLGQLNGEECCSQAVAETYHPEVIDLVENTTGCKEVFIFGGVFRQGKRALEAYKLPSAESSRKPWTSRNLNSSISLQDKQNSSLPHHSRCSVNGTL
ncbi:hypothetical protein AC579_9199 [Pseudocercospora musae]|uniref:Uncharacterized protein n=1 Tax=Pseudocercospora musae TaxID=113226 RepID=A0A139GTG0_9PEZI|nr:hypothetical protein AC579_9199 [Pseudocercospora musae]